jgi:hypothetical protein
MPRSSVVDEIACPACGAAVGEWCHGSYGVVLHVERVVAWYRRRWEPGELSRTDL